ncbi:hypothetical protein TRIP_B350225 [uncultured Desulfatiglans sp.]|nr:hypothetical protein TRIP_B350225 [uncultured Desulfatiglans sp.]
MGKPTLPSFPAARHAACRAVKDPETDGVPGCRELDRAGSTQRPMGRRAFRRRYQLTRYHPLSIVESSSFFSPPAGDDTHSPLRLKP